LKVNRSKAFGLNVELIQTGKDRTGQNANIQQMHNIPCTWTVLKRQSRGFLQQAKGAVRIKSTEIRWFLGQSDGRLDFMRGGQRHSKTKLAQGGPSGSIPLRSDGSCDGLMGGFFMGGGQWYPRECWKTTLESREI
jgi:hypothetical protein